MKVKDQFHFPASNLICRYGPLCNHEILTEEFLKMEKDGVLINGILYKMAVIFYIGMLTR